MVNSTSKAKKSVAIVSIVVVALAIFCVVPVSASTPINHIEWALNEWAEILPDEIGLYPSLQSIEGEIRFTYDDSEKVSLVAFSDTAKMRVIKKEYSISEGFYCVGSSTEIKKALTEWLDEFGADFMYSDKWDFSNGDVLKLEVRPYPESEKTSGLISQIFIGFKETINGLASGVKNMFMNILWSDGTASSGLSGFAKFGFVMAGLSLALGLGYFIIRKIRG